MHRLSKWDGWTVAGPPAMAAFFSSGRDEPQVMDPRMVREGHQEVPDEQELEGGLTLRASARKYSMISRQPLPGSIRPA